MLSCRYEIFCSTKHIRENTDPSQEKSGVHMCAQACDVRVIILYHGALGIRESPVLCLELGAVCSVSFFLVSEILPTEGPATRSALYHLRRSVPLTPPRPPERHPLKTALPFLLDLLLTGHLSRQSETPHCGGGVRSPASPVSLSTMGLSSCAGHALGSGTVEAVAGMGRGLGAGDGARGR